MKIFALSDLHLSLDAPFDPTAATVGKKPMDVFGARWHDHIRRVDRAWRETVGDDDIVLVAGDISWAMDLEEARFDLAFLGDLPGKKVLIRGNHDYWWHSLKKVREHLPEGVFALQNDAVFVGDIALCGSRLWTLPTSPDFKSDDLPIYKRELIRLELSLKAAAGRPVIAMTHFMPIGEGATTNEVVELLAFYGAEQVVYGHLHDKSHAIAVNGEYFGMEFILTSADHLDCRPKLIREL